jgi:hypothetical protein
VRPLAAARALFALGPNTAMIFPEDGAGQLARLGALVRRLPCFEMDLARDLDTNPPVLRRLIESLAQGPDGAEAGA